MSLITQNEIPFKDFSTANNVGQVSHGVDHRYITLNLTQQCNLHCTYCYQEERRVRKKSLMPFEIAKATLKDYLTREDGYSEAIIELIGGEVFLYWKQAKRIITWALENKDRWNKTIVFFIDTNGTLLTDQIKEWLYERRHHVTLGLSLDGTPEAQNINRSGSYEKIAPHLPFFAKTWPHQTVKMTISPQTVPMIFDGILHIMKQGLRVAANVPMENIWGSPKNKKKIVTQFQKEIEKLVDFFSRHQELPVPSLIDLPISAILSEKDKDRAWCGAGRNMVAVEKNGTQLPCNRFDSMSFDQSLFNKPLGKVNSPCYKCAFRPACQTCEAHNWEVNGNPINRTRFHCEFIKIQIWGTAQLRANRLELKLREIQADTLIEEKTYVKVITETMNELKTVQKILEKLDSQGLLDKLGLIRFDRLPINAWQWSN